MTSIPLKDRRYYIAVRVAGKWRRVNATKWKGGGPTFLPPLKSKRYGTHDVAGVAIVRAWAKRVKYVTGIRVTMLNPYPFLVLDGDTGWPAKTLCSKLNALGRSIARKLRIREGTRTHARQAQLYAENMAAPGRPKPGHPLTAAPGTSNHEDHDGDGYGEAADVGVLPTDTNLGDFKGARQFMHTHGLCLPVPGETWHAEEGDRWRA